MLIFPANSHAEVSFPPTRMPFQPELVVDNVPGTCQRVHELVLAKFREGLEGAEPEPASQVNAAPIPFAAPLEWTQMERGEMGAGHFGNSRLDVDLDGDGNLEALVIDRIVLNNRFWEKFVLYGPLEILTKIIQQYQSGEPSIIPFEQGMPIYSINGAGREELFLLSGEDAVWLFVDQSGVFVFG